MTIKFSKKQQLSSELLIVDGFWGVGKSVIGELVSVFNSMECWRIDLPFDHIPILYEKKSIDESAAIAIIRNLFDEISYNVAISRSVNFRYKDLTSIWKHPKKYEYILRMFEEGGSDSLKKISDNKMIIPISTHLSTSNNDLFLRSLGKRCKIIRCDRHPLFIVDNWANYIDRCQTDPREFTLNISYKQEDIPFFADGWEDEYLSLNNLEKSIKSISVLTSLYESNYSRMRDTYGSDSILEISFEDAVENTDNVVRLMSEFLNRDVNYTIYKKVNKREKLSRKTAYLEPGHKLLKHSKNKVKELEEFIIKEKLSSIKNNVDLKYYDELMFLIGTYEKKWFN